MNGTQNDQTNNACDGLLLYRDPEQEIELNAAASLTPEEKALYTAPTGESPFAQNDSAGD